MRTQLIKRDTHKDVRDDNYFLQQLTVTLPGRVRRKLGFRFSGTCPWNLEQVLVGYHALYILEEIECSVVQSLFRELYRE